MSQSTRTVTLKMSEHTYLNLITLLEMEEKTIEEFMRLLVDNWYDTRYAGLEELEDDIDLSDCYGVS